MSRVDELLSSYAAAFEAGERPDPQELLLAAGDERPQLEAALERFLREAPRRRWDAAAFAGSGAAGVAGGLDRSLGSAAGLWPALLPRLRARAQLRRADLVGHLAAALGAQAQREKVGAYYHEMERGLLPAAGVSDSVLEALGAIVGESTRALREAGASALASSGPNAPAPAFARRAPPSSGKSADPARPVEGQLQQPGWDEVDRLFRGSPA